MEKQTEVRTQKGKSLIILGFVVIAILFLIYARTASLGLTPEAVLAIERLAGIFYVIIIMAFGVITFGLFRYHKQKALENNGGVLSIIAATTFNKKSRRIFLLTFIGYGIFFSLTSGMLVYQPEVVFSYHYGAIIPSAHLTACCGDPGYMPKITVYLTEHIGLQIVPINLVLQIIVSYLVGLNTTLAVSAFTFFKKEGGLSSVGATTGLFIACPTCVGAFSSIFVGSAGAIAFTLAITQLQTMFILITIPILLITPFIMAKKLRVRGGNCATETKHE
ncbi:MAG: hypothetical protein XU09_C0009G0005 [Thaumarchaeota archaeon CSP1-1]|nr:MAG: hypothetical protein XU09_C0009G0005 [Thaumarchaeota archaeon CSP1-1]